MRPIVPASALVALACVSLPAATAQPAARPFTIEDLMNVKRLSDPEVSPDGRYVAFVLRETDLAANRGRTDIWLLELGSRDAEPRRLTRTADNDSNPRWAPDSRTLYFLSERSGSSQIWRLTLDGGEAIRVSDYPLDVSALELSPRGDRLAFGMEVFPDCRNLACTRERLDAAEKSEASGRTHQRLFVRHWDTWKNGTRSHLFSAALAPDGTAGPPVDLSGALDARSVRTGSASSSVRAWPAEPNRGPRTSICTKWAPLAPPHRAT
jgi:dipeptidyl aminopeptidase/acylaminoacyl peptidase